MKTSIYALDEQMEAVYSKSLYAQRDDNIKDINKMKSMIRSAMKYALTEKQRQCLTMYYFDKQTIPEIAANMGLNKSTVSRHIKAASKNLKKLRSFI